MPKTEYPTKSEMGIYREIAQKSKKSKKEKIEAFESKFLDLEKKKSIKIMELLKEDYPEKTFIDKCTDINSEDIIGSNLDSEQTNNQFKKRCKYIHTLYNDLTKI